MTQIPETDITERPATPGPILTSILVIGTSLLIFFLGMVWLLSQSDQLPFQSRSPIPVQLWLWVWLTMLGSILFTTFTRLYTLLRGIGFAFLVISLYVLLNGIFVEVDAVRPYPGLWNGWPHLIMIGALIGIIASTRASQNWSTMPVWRTGFGLLIALLVPIGFPFWGSLGIWAEIGLAFIEALSMGGALAVALWGLFRFAPHFMEQRPVVSRWMANLFGLAFLPLLFAGRGDAIYGVYGLILMGFATLILGRLIIWPRLDKQPLFLAPALSFTITLCTIILLSFEGLEVEFMPLDLLGQITVASGVGILTILFIWVVWAIFNFKPQEVGRRKNVPFLLAILLAFPLTINLYGRGEAPLVQPREYFVVMQDQAGSAFLQEIADRDERVQTAYTFYTEHAAETQTELRAWLDAQGVSYRPFYIVNGLEIVANERTKRRLERREDVAYVLESPEPRPLKPFSLQEEEGSVEETLVGAALGAESNAPNELTWGIQAVKADLVWERFEVRGEGIVVGIADSGADWTHSNLNAAYRGAADEEHNYNWFDPHFKTAEPVDSPGSSHGTHVTGTVLGQNNTGVAPRAEWIACRNLPRNLGNPADYLDCMQFLFAPFPLDGDPFTDGDPLRGAHLTNNSWGCPPEEGCDGRTLGIGVENLRHAGQLMVVSAGNAGPGCQSSDAPAMGDAAFSVGAISESLRLTSFSSRGPGVDINGELILKPDITAPGFDVISSIVGEQYASFPGTSMASPHVSGVVALIWSANPALIGNIDATEELIRSTAQEIEVPESDELCGESQNANEANTIGAGLIDAFAAVEAALALR